MLDYLYYKLYRASEKSSLGDIPEFLSPVFLGGLISANILVICAFLAKIDLIPFPFSNRFEAGGLSFIIIVVMGIIYKKKRYKIVLTKYDKESDKERVRGNLVVFTYVIISFLLIFAVAFFRPGKL